MLSELDSIDSLYIFYKEKLHAFILEFLSESQAHDEELRALFGLDEQIDNFFDIDTHEEWSKEKKIEFKERHYQNELLREACKRKIKDIFTNFQKKLIAESNIILESHKVMIQDYFKSIRPLDPINYKFCWTYILIVFIESLCSIPKCTFLADVLLYYKNSIKFVDRLDALLSLDYRLKSFYFCSFLGCIKEREFYEIFEMLDSSLFYLYKMNYEIEERIKKIMSIKEIVNIYCKICNVTEEAVKESIDPALKRTYEFELYDYENTIISADARIYLHRTFSNLNYGIEAADIILFMTNFVHFLRKTVVSSFWESMQNPLVENFKELERELLGENIIGEGGTIETQVNTKPAIKIAHYANDLDFLFQRAAFGSKLRFFNMEAIEYLVREEDFKLETFKKLIEEQKNRLPSKDSYIFN